MIIKAVKTHKITEKDNDLFQILDKYLPEIVDGEIVAITSKIVSITEGKIIPLEKGNKDELIKSEADYYLPKEKSKYDLYLTIKNSRLAVSAGIDESNANGNYVLWPEDPQKSANKIREYLKKKFNLERVGVIITDSMTTPLRFGVMGMAIAHSGFSALNDLIGSSDIFGRKLKMTKVSVLDGLAASAVLLMGEGGEQTPVAVISDVPFVKFQNRNPSREELADLKIKISEDVYAPLINSVEWKSKKKI